MRELWIADRHKGQLGNKLMFFAAAYAWCLEEGAKLYWPTLHRYADLFPAMAGQRLISPNDPSPVDESPARRAARQQRTAFWLRLAAKLRVLPGVVRKPSGYVAVALPPTWQEFPSPALRVRGRLYMTAWRFFNPVGIRRHRDAILAATRPQPEIERDADRFASALAPDRLWIGVHVRGGDYAGFVGGKHFHPVERYVAEMHAVAERFRARRPGFVIFSDQPRNAAEFPGLDVLLSAGSAIEDLTRMSRLKLVIGPLSTFSAWAMYRSGGVAFHFGPPAKEDGLEWVYSGYPVARSLEEAARGFERVEGGARFEPEIDVASEALRPAKQCRVQSAK